MDLPPELRNQIYRQLLETHSEILVTRRKKSTRHSVTTHSGFVARNKPRQEYEIKATTLGMQDGRKRRLAVAKVHPLELLRLSKTIHEEARPIFYGANTFTFDTPYALELFQRRTYGNFGFLKNINIKCVTPKGYDHLGDLAWIKAPTQITIGISMHVWNHDLAAVGNHLGQALSRFVRNKIRILEDHRDFRATAELAKQSERFDTVHFEAGPEARFRLADRTIVTAAKPQESHNLIRGAIFEVWESWQRMKEADEKAREKARKADEWREKWRRQQRGEKNPTLSDSNSD